jgi:uncharacterized protein YjaZ
MKNHISTPLLFFLTILVFSCSSVEDPLSCTSDSAIDLGFESCLTFENDSDLLDYRDSIEFTIRESLTMVNTLMPISNLRILVRSTSYNVIPEIGIGGFNPNSTDITISIDPNFEDLTQSLNEELGPLMAHEIHHANRRRQVGYGLTLLQTAVSEGMADCFSMEVYGIDPPRWSTALNQEELISWFDTASTVWNDADYNHADWFFGASLEIPKWTGYTIGYKLIKDFIQDNPGSTAAELVTEPATIFVEN